MLKIKPGKMPKIAVSAADDLDNKSIKSARPDILEIRVDLFKKLSPGHISHVIASREKTGIPIILTIRSKEEGGGKKITDEVKLNIFRDNISLVNAVDIELCSPILADVVRLAKRNKKTIIVSYHNFKSTPDKQFLKRILIDAKKAGANIVKIAAFAKNLGDVIKLAEFTLENKSKNLITISLGNTGRASRFLFPMIGSLITYSYIVKPSGPGQIPLKKLRGAMRLYY